jgi:hypothetical protein
VLHLPHSFFAQTSKEIHLKKKFQNSQKFCDKVGLGVEAIVANFPLSNSTIPILQLQEKVGILRSRVTTFWEQKYFLLL